MAYRAALRLLASLCLLAPRMAWAQAARYEARLSVMPLTVAMQSTVAGEGLARASLSGARLTIDGEFSGLRSRATLGEVRTAQPGLRGPESAKLAVVAEGDGTKGKVHGVLDLTPGQLQDLNTGRLYIQLSSEKAPDGNLRGWLFPAERTR